MDSPWLYQPEPFKFGYGKVSQYRGGGQQPRRKNSSFKSKGMERWHRAVSTNLVKQNVFVPEEESSSRSDMEFHESQQSPKKNIKRKVKTFVYRMLSYKYRSKPANVSREGTTQSLLPRVAKELPSPGLCSTPRMRKLSQNGNHRQHMVKAETEEITQGNRVLWARRTTKRFSVTSLPSGLRKGLGSMRKRQHFPILKRKKHSMENILQKPVGKLQMQVDDLIVTVTDKSMKLLAQRHTELQ
ncbi:putative uncharacterized protein C3orf49 homolog [Sturnira hondurensis]|uniref:putative uncharacterized protein C3orf49 homolog n=1 Tax=Sturnira hondurensis TaxID=192404 RepID=UPI001878FF23|nr:putative uncharacterized protein C3orf49 homolog [Sturnira hondurensis]